MKTYFYKDSIMPTASLMHIYSIAQSLTSRDRMVAILYNKKKIYAIGYSSSLTHKQLFNNRLYFPSLHAEVDAITKAYNNYVRINKKILNCDILITRYVGSSKPCVNCLEVMKNPAFCIRIRNVSYCEDGQLKTEKLSELQTDHVSRGFKYMKASSAGQLVSLP